MGESATPDIAIPSDVLRKWQRIVDLLASIMSVPSAVVTTIAPTYSSYRTLVSSASAGNPFPVDDRPRDLLIRTERAEGDWVRLSVKDAGVGFDPHTADRLFEPFYSTKNDGMGVGLAVSRSIIENHQGRLWAVLHDGPGATFSFSVPCRAGTPLL